MSSSSEAEFDDAQPIGKLRRENGTNNNGPIPVKSESMNYNDDDESMNEPIPSNRKRASASRNKKKRRVKERDDDDDDDDDDEYEEIEEQPKKKRKSSSTTTTTKPKAKKRVKATSTTITKKKTSNTKTTSTSKAKKENGKADTNNNKALKRLEKADRIAHAMQSFLWWDAQDPPEGCQWGTMEHAGVSFAEKYEPHGVKMKYNGDEVDLNPVEEEAATFFAAMDPDGMHLGNPKTAPIFIKNFFTDFKKSLSKTNKSKIKDFKKCDFEAIRHHLNEQKIVKKAVTDEQRKVNKTVKNETMFKFGYSLVDGHIEKIGNYNMEPPGTFRGRGEHPKMGKLKNRVYPEQVSLNVSECARVPPCSIPGHAWGELRHDPTVQWLCQWKENINNQDKYMQLAAQSSFKGKSDRSKYSKAALLCENIDKIRASYKKKLKSKTNEEKQLATAMWVIDRLALRVGGEKDTDEEADTVGCCSLRVEHLHFDPNGEGGDNLEIELEFLGKDSMLFKQTIDFGATMYTENNGMGEQVYANFKRFCSKKKQSEEVFDVLTPSVLNTHLKSIMDGLTAKVFRTYNASKTLQDELHKQEKLGGWSKLTPAEMVVEYNNANRQVAILCNHQKSVSKAQETQLENIGDKIKTLKKQKSMLKKILKVLKVGGKNVDKIPVKKDEKKKKEQCDKALAKAKQMKEKATSKEAKIAATEADEKAKEMKRDLAKLKFEQAHLWDKTPSKDQAAKKIQSWTEKIAKMEMNLKHKDDNKEVSLGTSKINYMDPRISVAWCKRNDVPIEKIFSKTLRDKFNWAMAVTPDWEFNASIGKQG
mmetsp:Transcript_22207/g.25711  ORF Transcript_22207/g.25711 Transcript_22207/m.25711 type:complete len:816 (-) Transcript_22207:166-2613(-)